MAEKIKKQPVYKDDLLTIDHGSLESLLTVTWSDSCNNLNDEGNTRALMTMNDTIKVFNPELLLIDFQKCEYFLSPENLDREKNLMISRIKAGNAAKVAVVVPGNLFVYPIFEAVRVSLERDLGNVMFFRDQAQALSWLLL